MIDYPKTKIKTITPYFETDLGKLYCGDCVDIIPELEPVDLVITSPPYDTLRDYKGYNFDFKGIAKELYQKVKTGGIVVWVVGDATIKGSETGTSFRQALYFKELNFRLFDTIIYQKRGGLMTGAVKGHSQKFEYMFVFSKTEYPKTINLIKDLPVKYTENRSKKHRKKDGTFDTQEWGCGGMTRRSNVWIYDVGMYKTTKDKIAFNHPAVFPERLAKDHIISWSNENNLVLDPMMGSGTVAKMCEKLNRHWIGIEISEEYCEIAAKRIKSEINQPKLFIWGV